VLKAGDSRISKRDLLGLGKKRRAGQIPLFESNKLF
jgi:hypothetical protein